MVKYEAAGRGVNVKTNNSRVKSILEHDTEEGLKVEVEIRVQGYKPFWK